MHPTPFPDLNSVLAALVEGARETLNDNFLAASLQGSFAVGDFDLHSDADFIIAVVRPLADAEVAALQSLHDRIHHLDSPWAVHLEGSYFPASVLRSCSRRKEELWYLDHGSKTLVRSDHCNSAVVRQVLRSCGIRLAGPEPRDLVDPVPEEILCEEIRSTMHNWGEEILARPEPWRNRFYQGFIVLNYCRMWCDLVTKSVGSKRRGAEWAKKRVKPPWRSLIDRAWLTRPNPGLSVKQPADGADFDETLDYLRQILSETENLEAPCA